MITNDLVYILLNLISVSSTYFHIQYIENKTSVKKMSSLPDLIVDNLPNLSRNYIIRDFINYSILLWILPFLLSKRVDLVYFVYKIISVILFMRTLTKFFTIIPSQDNGCKNEINNPECYITGYCNDKIFSGHTSLSLILLLTAFEFDLVDKRLMPILLLLHFIYVGLILASRNHYTVDIILAYMISTSTFYHLKDII